MMSLCSGLFWIAKTGRNPHEYCNVTGFLKIH